VQQRLDIGLVRQALGFGEPLRECDVGLRQSDRQQARQYAMKWVTFMIVEVRDGRPLD
jgi:hypothetical protein